MAVLKTTGTCRGLGAAGIGAIGFSSGADIAPHRNSRSHPIIVNPRRIRSSSFASCTNFALCK